MLLQTSPLWRSWTTQLLCKGATALSPSYTDCLSWRVDRTRRFSSELKEMFQSTALTVEGGVRTRLQKPTIWAIYEQKNLKHWLKKKDPSLAPWHHCLNMAAQLCKKQETIYSNVNIQLYFSLNGSQCFEVGFCVEAVRIQYLTCNRQKQVHVQEALLSPRANLFRSQYTVLLLCASFHTLCSNLFTSANVHGVQCILWLKVFKFYQDYKTVLWSLLSFT